jgi:hypothetical protein
MEQSMYRSNVIQLRRADFGGGTYLNFPGFFEEGDKMMRDAYGENYHNIKPTGWQQS